MSNNSKFKTIIISLIALLVIIYFLIPPKLPINLNDAIRSHNDLGYSEEIKKEIPQKIFIVFDMTESMQGYVNYKETYSSYMKSLKSSLPTNNSVKFYALSDKLDEICTNSEADIKTFIEYFSNPKNYYKSQADLSLLKNLLAENSIILYLTDFEFNSDGYQQSFTEFFQYIIKEKKYAKIFKSDLDFKGNVYNLNKIIPYSGIRPYYCIAMGTSGDYKNSIDELLVKQDQFNNSSILSFSTNVSSEISNVEMSDDCYENFQDWDYYIDSTGFDHKDVRRIDTSDECILNTTLTIKNDIFLEWHGIDKNDIKFNFYSIVPHHSITQIKEDCDIITSINLDGNKLKMSFISDYLVSEKTLIKINVKASKYPEWVGNINVRRDDADSLIQKGTINLSEFVTNILKGQSVDFTLTKVYLYLDDLD